LRRIGHKGADLIEPGNTLASFDAALAHGVDMIELDVLPEGGPERARDGRLILAHDYEDSHRRPVLTLDEGLEHLASAAYSELEFIFDLKLPGYESRVVGALERSGLAPRAIVSTTYRESLLALQTHHGAVRVGWSVPRARRDYTKSPFMAVPALAVLRVMRARLPRQAAAALSAGLCHAVMAHWRLVTPRLVETIAAAGGDLYVWTVDHAPRIRELDSLGVTGVITNDPRLFAALPSATGN
jgi:glycerophosphoryl diester phosphodiesterase